MSSSFVPNGASLEDCHCNLFCLVSAGAAGGDRGEQGGGGGGREVRPWAVGEGSRSDPDAGVPGLGPAGAGAATELRTRLGRRVRSPTVLGSVLGELAFFLVLFLTFFPSPPWSCFQLGLLIWQDTNTSLCLTVAFLIDHVSFHTFHSCPFSHCLYASLW